jgi:hypothetical protein
LRSGGRTGAREGLAGEICDFGNSKKKYPILSEEQIAVHPNFEGAAAGISASKLLMAKNMGNEDKMSRAALIGSRDWSNFRP